MKPRPSATARARAAERLLLLEAACLLGAARLAILALPFRVLAGAFGRRQAATPAELPPQASRVARRVSWAVRTAARRVGWRADCLPQAIAARLMLRARGVPATLYLGLKNGQERELLAHAWLRAGRLVVTGRRGHREFARITSFA